MPMPEMPGVLVDLWYRCPVSIEESNKINRTWDKDRKACYAAGKADALPPWPPEDGAEFKWGNRESIFKFKFGRWSCSRLPQHEYEPFFILDIREQVALTVAWFKGELEEVK